MLAPPLQGAAALTHDVLRGVCRMLLAQGHSPVPELTLPTGRRLDVAALSPQGAIIAVEIKVSVGDFQGDQKWGEYLDFCDEFYFAVPESFPIEMLPDAHGLIVADRFGGATLRPSPVSQVQTARRKAMTLRIARAAAERWHRGFDPDFRGY
ncbi:MAG: MmcB family DNA repair protein [Alphaproteobacteria bacterium]|nr:MmcB family DNA repair protein [Alphaproteobacteria bacterium]